jgi:hypothetical protein
MARVVVTGGTGFVGGALVGALTARGDSVAVLSRSAADSDLPEGARAARWDPTAAGSWGSVLEGADAVVHLAGEPAVGARWTTSTKQRIRDSRVLSTRAIVDVIAESKARPSTLVCASGVGIYGHRPAADLVDEDSEAGHDFLAQVCVDWESAAERARDFSVRVVCSRLGVVLGPDGGALTEMVKPFRVYAGGPLGSGRQIVSWVSLEDAVRILLLCIDDDSLSGPVNVVAPRPVANAELSRAIGEVLGKPSWLRVPATALKLRFGEGADPLLTGQRVEPRVLRRHGYVWAHPDVRSALRAALT